MLPDLTITIKDNKFPETVSVFAKKLPWLALFKKHAGLRKFTAGTKPMAYFTNNYIINKQKKILKIKVKAADKKKGSKIARGNGRIYTGLLMKYIHTLLKH